MAKKPATLPDLEYVSPDLLDFDPENPRFGGLITTKKQDAIQTALMNEPYLASELIDSFLANGYIDYEPLVVKRNGGRFTIVEGNRRLAAIKEIRDNPAKYEGKKADLDKIPVLIFPAQPDEQQQNEMRVYLGVRHLLGFREWPPLSKAQFLAKESAAAAGGLGQVLKETRLTRSQARRFLVPLRLLDQAGVKIPDGEDFWVLGEALQRAGIKNFLQLEVSNDNLEIVSYNKKNLGLLLDDLYGPKVKDGKRDPGKKIVNDTRDLSRLSKVLGSEKAAAVLRGGKTLDEAEIHVDTREESVKRLTKANKQLGVIVRKLASPRDAASADLAQAYKGFDAAVRQFLGNELL